MTRSSILPSVALAVSMGSLFAPPVMGFMGLVPAPAARESALLIERQDATAHATSTGAFTRNPRTAAAQCPVVNAGDRAPLPPSLRTVVADLAPVRSGP